MTTKLELKPINRTTNVTVQEEVEFIDRGDLVVVRMKTTTKSTRKRKPIVMEDTILTTKSALAKRKCGKNVTVATVEALDYEDRYQYLTESQYARLMEEFGSGVDVSQELWEEVEANNVWEMIQEPDFDPKRCICIHWDDGMVYRAGSDMPVSKPMRIDYIGGVANDNYDLHQTMRILEKKKCVYDIDKVQIPYYNRSPNHTHAIEFTVWLSQADYNKLVRYWRDEVKHEFWTCRVKDSIAWKPWYEGAPDILGLGKAYQEAEEVEVYREDY